MYLYFMSTKPGYWFFYNLAVNNLYYLPIIYGNPLKYINRFWSIRWVGDASTQAPYTHKTEYHTSIVAGCRHTWIILLTQRSRVPRCTLTDKLSVLVYPTLPAVLTRFVFTWIWWGLTFTNRTYKKIKRIITIHDVEGFSIKKIK